MSDLSHSDLVALPGYYWLRSLFRRGEIHRVASLESNSRNNAPYRAQITDNISTPLRLKIMGLLHQLAHTHLCVNKLEKKNKKKNSDN